MRLLIAFIVLVSIVPLIFAQDTCNQFLNCGNCTGMADCGWCGPTATCITGNKQGPTTAGQRCYGDAWFFKNSNPCPECLTLPDCKSCNLFSEDCFWCDTSSSCREWGSVLGCKATTTCPCDIYDTCSQCVTDPGCLWCGVGNGTCANVGSNCSMPAHTCPCNDNTDCTACLEDQVAGCVWCENSGGGTCTSNPGSCLIAHNCNSYCSEQGTTCDGCTLLNGCAWCESTSTCVDATSTTCNFLSHACPDCGNHHYCDTCQDAGCIWCQNGECRRKGDTVQCTEISAGNCNTYCAYFSDCFSCNVIPGCNWCDDISLCVDSDKSTCHVALACGGPMCAFDGGAFVGGMFLGIGLVAIGIGAFLFYRWKVGKKATYSELK